MANLASFDITSGVDLQEVDNAVNQANKEIAQRYDFKGSKASIEFNKAENSITLTADNDFKMTALWEILQTRLVRRGVPTKNLTPGALFFALVHPFLNAVLGVDKSFTCVCHSHLLC